MKKILLISILLILLLVGCSNQIKVPFIDNNNQLKTNIEVISEDAHSIIYETEQIELNSPTAHTQNIKENAKDIINRAEEVKDINVSITKDYQELQKDLEKTVEERDKAIEQKNNSIQKTLKWLITLSIIGIGVFGVLFFLYGSKAGMTGASICGSILLLSLFIQTYLTYLIIAGAVLFALLLALFFYLVVIKGKAFKEIVSSIEKVKEDIPIASDKIKETMAKVQSKRTSKIVHKEKAK